MRSQKLIFLFSFATLSIFFLLGQNTSIAEILHPYVVDEKPQVLFGDSLAVGEYRGLENYTQDYVNGYAHFSFTYSHGKCCRASRPPLVYVTDVDPRISTPSIENKEIIYHLSTSNPTDWYLYDVQFDATGYRVSVKQAGETEVFGKYVTVTGIQNNYWVAIANNYPILSSTTFSMSFTPVPVYSEAIEEIPVCTIDCFSNVLFLPGLMGSKLYGSDENELWVSMSDADHTELLLDNHGKSIDTSISTKGEVGVIDEIFGLNIYKSFIDELKGWKEEGTISDYALVPYDWRLSLEDIISNGTAVGDNISYNIPNDFSESFILKKLEELQASSRSGKVTIITHSNGGLVAKALVQKLKDTNHPLYEKIDKIIFVAVPQIGTPDALAALLHGTELGHGFIMGKDRARSLSENMPTVYNLLPSASYFDTVDPAFAVDKLVSFEDTPFYDPQISKYGVFVSNQTELKDYILGTDGRVKPIFSDTKNPNIGNSTLYEQAEEVHEILDDWKPHPDTKVIQVAGWGAETIAGLDYKVYRDTAERISYTPRMVIDGDSTVVAPSALWMPESENVERWWVNLIRYNEENFPDRVHRNILEIPNLTDFIKSKITDSEFSDSDDIMVDNASTLVSSDSRRLHFILHSPLTLGITDSEGNYTGMDPNTGEIKEEIPDVDYRQIGEVQFISAPAGTPYTLQLEGYADGHFSLDVREQTGNEVTNATLFEGMPSSSSTLATLDVPSDFEVSTSQLQVDVDGDEAIDQIYPIVEVVEVETPPADIEVEVETPVVEAEAEIEDNPETSSSSSGSVAPRIAETVAEPEVDEEVENTETEETLDLDTSDTLETIIEEPQIEQEEIGVTETPTTEEEEETQDLSLTALVADSGIAGNWIWYIGIISILIILFLLRKFIKI